MRTAFALFGPKAARTVGAFLAVVSIATMTTGTAAARYAISPGKLPKPVTAAVMAHFAGSKIVSAIVERKSGDAVYEVLVKQDRQRIELKLTADGHIGQIARPLTVKELPKAVVHAVAQKYPKSSLKSGHRVSELRGNVEQLAHYEVVIVNMGGKRVVASVSPEGSILSARAVDDEDEDDDERDDEDEDGDDEDGDDDEDRDGGDDERDDDDEDEEEDDDGEDDDDDDDHHGRDDARHKDVNRGKGHKGA